MHHQRRNPSRNQNQNLLRINHRTELLGQATVSFRRMKFGGKKADTCKQPRTLLRMNLEVSYNIVLMHDFSNIIQTLMK